MKTSRVTPVAASAPPPTDSASGPIQAWTRFWFMPVDPIGLHVVRVLVGLLLLSWLLPFAGHLDDLFGAQGWFDHNAYLAMSRLSEEEGRLPVSWSLLFVVNSNSATLAAFYWGTLALIVVFTLGLWPRLTGLLTWVCVASFTVNPAFFYDGDALVLILAFYMMLGYLLLGLRTAGQDGLAGVLGPWPGWLTRLTDKVKSMSRPSLGANLALRLLQVHFAIAILASAFHKLQAGTWWSGIAFWYPLYPPFEATVTDLRNSISNPQLYIGWLSVFAYATLAWQFAFPVFAWSRRWRPLLIGGGVIAWLGNSFLYHLPLFGPAIFIGCLSYVSAEEWRRWFAWLSRLPGLNRLAERPEERALPKSSTQEADSLVTVGQR
ncbi:MAG: hypothetical protein ACK4RK_13475 [Gemmataceae bacterium]